MGVCASCTSKHAGGGEKDFDMEGDEPTVEGGEMKQSMSMRLNKMRTLSAKDIKGFKKA
jgi:hypothetical protein